MDPCISERNSKTHHSKKKKTLKVTPLCDSSVCEGDDSALPSTVYYGATLRQNRYLVLHGIPMWQALWIVKTTKVCVRTFHHQWNHPSALY